MADEQPTKKQPTKKKGKKDKPAPPRDQQSSTALVASHDPETAAVDQLEQTLDTIAANQATMGELTLSYPARDVALVLDGLTAARVVAAFADPSRRSSLQDELNAASSMRNLWASFDLDRLLAVSWMPGLPDRATSRMTVDPPNPHASVDSAETAAAAAGD
jgi:hypothetical protein